MNENLEQRIEKLPQWAQRYIGKLHRGNAALRAGRGKIADGDARITFWVRFGEVHSIPDRATVAFRLENDIIEFSLETMLDGLNEVRVRSIYQRLVITPAASNAINLSAQRR